MRVSCIDSISSTALLVCMFAKMQCLRCLVFGGLHEADTKVCPAIKQSRLHFGMSSSNFDVQYHVMMSNDQYSFFVSKVAQI